jgi:enamine deaminase RidA (YjgF/YER057c/UK114 family)
MMLKIFLMICTAAWFAAYPVQAQRQDGAHGHHGHHGHHGIGNGSDHSGHNGSDHSGHNGDDDGDDDDDDQGEDGQNNLVLALPEIRAAVANAATSVTTALRSSSLTTSAGALIPVSAQMHTYSLLSADPTLPASSAAISAALSTAGPQATAIVPSLLRSFSGLSSNPEHLPSALSRYNRFTRVASAEFISNPPPEYVALHVVLAKLVQAAGSTK